jgi:hypothetical protein
LTRIARIYADLIATKRHKREKEINHGLVRRSFSEGGLTQIDADYFRQDNSPCCEQRQDAVRQAGVLGNLAIVSNSFQKNNSSVKFLIIHPPVSFGGYTHLLCHRVNLLCHRSC